MSRERDGAFCSREGLPRLSRERDGAFCSRKGLPRLSCERNGAFCSREGSPSRSRERDSAFCSREGLPRSPRERDGAFCSRKGSAAVLLGDEECVLSPKSPVILTYVILPCTTERQNGTKVSPKRASLHSRATISAKSVALECRLGVARGRILERSKEYKWMVLLLSKTKTHTTVALYGENAAVVIGQGSGGAFQGI